VTADLPLISVLYDADSGLWRLYATSYNDMRPAGERLFRAPPHPAIRFSHEDREQAETDAGKLREYVERVWTQRGPSKAQQRKQHD
jgi:hypothetical protein